MAKMEKFMNKYEEKTRTQYVNKVKNHLVSFFEGFYAKNNIPFFMYKLLYSLEAGIRMPPIREYLEAETKEPGRCKTSIQAYKVLCKTVSASVSKR